MRNFLCAISCILLAICVLPQAASAQDVISKTTTEVIYPVHFNISAPLRDVAKEHPWVDPNTPWESGDRIHRPHQTFIYSSADGPEYGEDPAVRQTMMGTRDISNKAPLMNWAGQVYASGRPMDPSGAVDDQYYIQAINATPFRIYNKATGAPVTASVNIGNLWSPAVANAGDPIIMYDKFADRWFISQFGSGNQVYIAISTTGDPTGSYYCYTYISPQFPDYLKFSIWADGYYMTSNQTTDKIYVFERDQMLLGNLSARGLYASFTTGSVGAFFVPLPADAADSPTLPTVGTAFPFFAYYDNAWGGGTDGVKIWNVTTNWTAGTVSVAAAIQVNTSAFDASYNPLWNDVTQPGTTQKLDGIGGVPTYRAQWRKWTGYNSLVLNWGVLINSTTGQRAIRWAELRQDQGTGTWSLYQESTYAPDVDTRWMGSIAMDNNGSIGLCYAKSSSTVYPGLYYTGRLATDPLGTMSFAEVTAVAGTSFQTGTNRFGDYAHTALDPDGITFWHTGEYISSGVKTRIYSFQLPAGALAPVASFVANATAPVCTGTVQFTDQSNNAPTSWLWNFGDGQTSTLQNPSHTYAASGTYTVSLQATNAIGNNTLTRTNYITISLSSAPIATGNSRCGTGIVTLSATGNNVLHWYSAASGGTELGTGLTYNTPSIATTTTYYVENVIPAASQYVGPVAAGAANTTASYLTFDVTTSCILVSVAVNNGGTAGNRTVELRNSAGTILNTTTVSVPAGASRITLNWILPVGTGLRLASVANSNLWRKTTGVAYPYTLAGLVSITGCSAGATRYTFFFDWEVQALGCSSSRVPCVATINSTVTPSVAVTPSGTTICAGSTVNFTAAPTNGGTPTYQWQINGANTGTNSSTYSSAVLSNGNVVTCNMTSTAPCASPTTVTSNSTTMTVNPAVTPSVIVTPSASSICAGTSVTFTAAPTNGGTPTYQWKLNGGNVGTNSTTYTNNALAQGDVITCVMGSTANCASPTSATSNAVTMTVSAPVTPSVSVTPSASTICAGTSVTFTAAPTNGGTPSYQWQLNGGNVGSNSPTYSSTALAQGNVVTCIMTSNAACVSPATATSNAVTMTVNPTLTPSVVVTPTASTICAGTSVSFTAAPTNGGTPTYQWTLNGSNVGTNSTTYSNGALVQGDVVSCVMNSTATCASPANATSNAVTMTVNPVLTPSVSVTPSASTICAGTSVTFTAAPTNGGTPSYQWKLNGGNVGTNSATYNNAGLAQGDVVSCVMTSNATCASPASATSNAVTMTVNSTLTPVVSVNASATTICSGTNVTFTANPTNGGTPTYQWQLNGGNVGSNSDTYSNAALINGDVVTCQMGSSLSCALPSSATSNMVTITVTGLLTPAVAISPSASTICNGTSVTFTASPTNGGTPSYQWLLNGVNVGSNSPTWSSTSLVQGDVVNCLMGSSLSCAAPTSATSNLVTMTVNSNVVPAVAVGASATSICGGTNVTFTATPTNGGAPSYQWMLNGSNVGSNSPTYSTSGLANSDNISCVMTTTLSCASPTSATSNTVTITVNPSVTPAAIIGASATTICAGTSVTFNATAINGGSPSYQWLLNGSPVGSNSALYTNTALANADVISCQMTSTAACASPTSALSNGISMIVKPILAPSVLISSSPSGPVCPGTTKVFTPIPTNPGTSPTYDWIVDGSVVASGPTYSGIFGDGQIISCTMTSNADCVNPLTADAMPITISLFTVNSVTVSEAGGTLTSSATTGNQWYEITDGIIPGAINQTFTPTANGDYYTIVTDGNGCESTSNIFNMLSVSINENAVNPLITFSPNPTDGIMTVTFGQAVSNGQLIIENALGQKVYEETVNQPLNSNKVIDFSKYAVGVYFVVIKDANLELKQKVIFDK